MSEEKSKYPPRYPGGAITEGLQISGRIELRKRSLDGATLVWKNIQYVESTEWTLTEIRYS